MERNDPFRKFEDLREARASMFLEALLVTQSHPGAAARLFILTPR
jgi:hypothetical protein